MNDCPQEREQLHLRVAHLDATLHSIRPDDGASARSPSIRARPVRTGPIGSESPRDSRQAGLRPRHSSTDEAASVRSGGPSAGPRVTASTRTIIVRPIPGPTRLPEPAGR